MHSVHRLRAHGWFVGDGLRFASGIELDHVAVGPAGVLAVQVQWSDRSDPRGRSDVRARVAARELRHVLAARELAVEVVPAVLACGPGQPDLPGGVRVTDSVAYLFDDSSDAWITHLLSRSLLDPLVVDGVRATVAELLESATALAR